MKKRAETITGIDIGTSAIRVVVGAPQENGRLQIVGVGEAPSRGITKGTIADVEEAVTSVSEALERAERMVGTPLSRAIVGVNGAQIKVVQSHGVVAVSKPNGEVQESDVDRAVEQSQAVATIPNFEIVHVLPKGFDLDAQLNIKDPIGMTGIKLEAHTQIILALSSHIKNLTKCINRTGLELEGLVFSPLATATALLNKRQKDLGVALVTLGAATTSVVVFEEGELLHAAVIPIGSDHITSDLAIGLRTSIDIAERIKIEQGQVNAEKVSKRDEIDLAKYATEEMPRMLISRKDIAEIIEARVAEIFHLVNEELKRAHREGKLPAGIVLTGGGSQLIGLADYVKEVARLPVFLGAAEDIFTPIDKVRDSHFTAALGLVYFAEQDDSVVATNPMRGGMNAVQDMVGSLFARFRGRR